MNETEKNFTLSEIATNRTVMANCQSVSDLNGITRKYANVPIDNVHFGVYQRTQKDNDVQRLLKNWDDALCEPITVSFRDGLFYVVDGGHRLEAQKRMGRDYVACEVVEDMSDVDEAEIYMKQSFVKQTDGSMHMARILTNDPVEIEMMEICKNFNITVPERGTRGNHDCHVLGSIRNTRTVLNRDGAAGLRWIFNLIHKIHWDALENGYAGYVLYIFDRVYHELELAGYDMIEEQDRLVSILARRPAMCPATLANLGAEYMPKKNWKASTPVALLHLMDEDRAQH